MKIVKIFLLNQFLTSEQLMTFDIVSLFNCAHVLSSVSFTLLMGLIGMTSCGSFLITSHHTSWMFCVSRLKLWFYQASRLIFILSSTFWYPNFTTALYFIKFIFAAPHCFGSICGFKCFMKLKCLKRFFSSIACTAWNIDGVRCQM